MDKKTMFIIQTLFRCSLFKQIELLTILLQLFKPEKKFNINITPNYERYVVFFLV